MIFIERIRYKYYKEFLTMSKYYSINEFSKILGVQHKHYEIGTKMVNFIHIILLVMDIDIRKTC